MASVADARREPAASAAYVVQRGDTLSWIAACSGLSVGKLAQLNGISDPDLVIAGEVLRLPGEHRCAAPRRTREPRASVEVADSVPPRTFPRSSARFGVPAARAEGGRLLRVATARQEAADFEGALSLAEKCAQRLAPPSVLDSGADAIRARCYVVAGMAAAGLERPERAIEEFRQALAIDPTLELSSQTSPRIRELVAAAAVERQPSH